MAGTIGAGDGAIILGALVDIVDHQADGRAGGAALEQPGEDANPVGLAALRGEARGAGAPPIQPGLDVASGQPQPRGPPVADAALARAGTSPPAATRPPRPTLLVPMAP